MEREKKRSKNVTFTGNSQTINGPSTITLEDIKRNQKKDETPSGGTGGGGGVMRVNISVEGMDDDGRLINPITDKTYGEVKACIDGGGFAYAVMDGGFIGETQAFIIPITGTWRDEYHESLSFSMFLGDASLSVNMQEDGVVDGTFTFKE